MPKPKWRPNMKETSLNLSRKCTSKPEMPLGIQVAQIILRKGRDLMVLGKERMRARRSK